MYRNFRRKYYNSDSDNEYEEEEQGKEEEDNEEEEEKEESEEEEKFNYYNNRKNNIKTRQLSYYNKLDNSDEYNNSEDSDRYENYDVDEDDDYDYYYEDDDYNDDYDDDYADYDDDYDYDYYEDDYYYDKSKSIENKYIFDNKNSFTEKVDKTINPNPYLTINDNILNILMIAEKPSIARTIAKILSKHKSNLDDFTDRENWCLFEFKGYFKGKFANFVVSSVAGHLYQTEFLRKHQNFNMDPVELFDVPTVKTECDNDSFITADWLKDLARGKDILCLWLDCDREGENICYEVIHNTLPYMNKKGYQQVYRAIFSSLTKEDITKSFEQIENYPDNNLSLSVDAREVIDLKVGVSLTRFLTQNILHCLIDIPVKCKCLSYGPCQTPTLWFCVNRQKELEKQNLTYYKIYIELLVEEGHYVKIFLNKDYKDLNEVISIIRNIKKHKKNLEIKKLRTEKRQREHPSGLNTSNMLKISSTQLGLSPQATMNIAEKLYTKGYITYPRTETTQYASSYDFIENLNKFSKNKKYKKDISKLMESIEETDSSILSGGTDVGDHPPITPARNPREGALKGKELDLFELICQYYFASLSPDLEYENITYEFEIENEIYNSSCSVIKKMGFLKFLSFQKKEFITDNEVLEKNKKYEITDINYEKRKIENYITEAELIEEMEKNHIGTDASMSVHIANIVKRGYVRVDHNKRRLIPTKLGKALIEALEAVEPDIVLPKNRAKIEEFVSLLSEGKKDYDEVLNYALEFYKKKYFSVSSQIKKIYEIFGKYFTINKNLNKIK